MSDTDQPVVAKQLLESVKRQRESTERFAEPVATQPACLCGLDTNPVASPRMDIHCPKHDAPESGGEPGDSTCKWCAKGDAPKVLDCDGTLISITGEVGVLSHAHEEYWWPCLRFGVELHSAAQPSSTPADEEMVLRMISDSLSLDSLEILPARELKVLQDRITTALAEARRAGTPTTDAREQARYEAANVVHHIQVETGQLRQPLWEEIAIASIAAVLSSTPSDEVAQRARKAAESVIAHLKGSEYLCTCGTCKKNSSNRVQEVAAIIIKHFATDVEQGTCMWTLSGTRQWRSQCGDISHHRDGDFCCFCGKPLAEATKESEANNVR